MLARRRSDWGHSALGALVGLMERFETLGSVLEHPFVDDRVTLIDTHGLVSDHLHGRGTRDTGPFEVTDRRAAEIMGNATDQTRTFAR